MKKLYLNGPDGIKIRRHVVADNDIRFTVAAGDHRKLVAWARNGYFVWVCKGFST